MIEMRLAYSIYLLDLQARQCSQRTIENYRGRLNHWLTWLEEQAITRLDQITAQHIRQYYVARQQTRNSPVTVHTEARVLRAFLNFCVREGWLVVSPLTGVAMPRKPKIIKTAIAMADIRRALRKANEQETAILLLFLDTGMRVSEACSLERKDIDLATGAIKIRQGKGAKDRQVYISAKTIKALMRYWATLDNSIAHVIVTERGQRPFIRSTLRRVLVRMGERNGVQGLTPHAIRRTFAIESLRAGMNIYVLQRLMGHEDIETLRQYLDIVDADMADATCKYGVVSRL